MHRASSEYIGLERIVAELMEPVDCCFDENGCSAPLPSLHGVISIINDLRELLFPGVHRIRRQPDGVVFELQALLARVQSRLRIEIGRALVHASRSSIRLHGAAAANVSAEQPSSLQITETFLARLPQLKKVLCKDLTAAYEGDPAAATREEIILCYPGLEAVLIYRIAHELRLLGVPYLPRMMTEWAHRETGIDIHPGAVIGESFFIDHGTGVVIGETCEIGDRVTLYQGVTLGAWSFPRDEEGNLIRGTKRHPTLESDVTVYSNATILGGTTVIGSGSQIGSSVSLNRSVPPNTIVTIERPSLRFREAA